MLRGDNGPELETCHGGEYLLVLTNGHWAGRRNSTSSSLLVLGKPPSSEAFGGRSTNRPNSDRSDRSEYISKQ